MAEITRITARIVTGDLPQAGTDGLVYLGIAGREFRLQSEKNDFARHSDLTYVMGEPIPNASDNVVPVKNPQLNDPRVDYVLQSRFLDLFPVYIRFEPVGDDEPLSTETPNWNLELATVKALSQSNVVASYENLSLSNNLWLGRDSGQYCYLTKLP